MAENLRSAISYLAVASGFSTLFYSIYYLQQLSYSIGFYNGITSVSSSYAQSTSTLIFAIHITYIMLVFSLILLIIGIFWLLTRSHYKRTSMAVGFAAIIYLLLAFLLQSDLTFNTSSAHLIFFFSYVAAGLGLAAAALGFMESFKVTPRSASHQQIEINPATPYTNMLKLSNKLGLSGAIRILDMHFDHRAIENLLRILGSMKGRYTGIEILTTRERLGTNFEKGYNDFRDELSSANIQFELRILDENDAHTQHERIIMDATKAYKIPPLNIINKKSEHVVGINHAKATSRFENLWSRATKYENIKAKPHHNE